MNRPWLTLIGLFAFLAACAPAPALSPTPGPTLSAIPAALLPTQPSTQAATTTPDLSNSSGVFQKITRSTSVFHTRCDPLEIIFDVTTDSPEITSVVFFFRMKDKATGMVNSWSNGENMRSAGNGMFEFIFRASAIPGEFRYAEAWVQYQFVGVDSKLKNIGHSQIFSEDLTFRPTCP